MSSSDIDLVVLIDDSDIDLFVQRRFIEISSFAKTVQTFQSARKALEQLSTPEQARPGLIFLDLNMPEMDGFSFLEHMTQLPVQLTQATRVVILTSSSSTADKERAATFSNVISFLSKPLTERGLQELKASIIES